jgi:predicted nucleic acid-binding protein
MAKKPTRKAIVFVDSSVLLAASLSSTGSAADLITYSEQGEITLCLCQMVLEEVGRNLHLKAPQGIPRFGQIRDRLAGTLAEPGQDLIDAVARIVEPKDAPIVAAAITAQAQHIVSYDRRHLVYRSDAIEAAFGIPVLTPADLILTLGLERIEHHPPLGT